MMDDKDTTRSIKEKRREGKTFQGSNLRNNQSTDNKIMASEFQGQSSRWQMA